MIEIAILPQAMIEAITKLLKSICPTGSRVVLSEPTKIVFQ